MTALKLLIFLSLSLSEIRSQYTQPPYDRQDSQYDRDRQDPQYNRDRPPYDRPNDPQRPYGQYDRQSNPPYGQQQQQQQYDRTNPPPYNRPYDRQNNPPPPYGQYDRPPYDRYDSSRPPYDRYNQSQPYNRPNQWGNQSQYDNQNQGPPYYDRNRPPYQNQPPYGDDRYNQGGNRDQYYPPNRNDQYGGNRNQPYDRNRDQYYTNNRNEQYGGGDQQYGSPLFDTNDNCCSDYCYSEDQEPYLQFATKTAYEFAYGRSSHGSNQHNVPDCKPVQFWSINRHGTRYPSARSISRLRALQKVHAEILKNYDEHRSYPERGRLCPKDLDMFRRWRWNETIGDREANALTRQGVEDLKFLARRYVSKFGELLKQQYSDSAYNFQYTDSDRTHDSYQAYIEGLFDRNAYQVHANVYNDDRLIKPTKSCNAWMRQVDDNPDTVREYRRFKQRPEYMQMVRDVFRRLGYRYTPGESIVDDMYDLCRYEKAWNLREPSPWCIAFNKDQLKMLEYAEDLKYYYKSGYGNEINRKVGCPPLKDLYDKFERTVNGDMTSPKVTVFFTHSVTIQTFLTAMGIAKDPEPLTADNYYRQTNRQWRTSKIDPFASNLVAVLYQCQSSERYRVMFFLNENPVRYEDCSNGLCSWATVKNKLEMAAINCNLDFCDQNSGSSVKYNAIVYFLSLIAIFYCSLSR